MFLKSAFGRFFSFRSYYQVVTKDFDNLLKVAVTTAEISDKLVTWGSIKKPMSLSRLGMVLQQAGFVSKRTGKARTRGWMVRERGLEEVNANRNIEGHGAVEQ